MTADDNNQKTSPTNDGDSSRKSINLNVDDFTIDILNEGAKDVFDEVKARIQEEFAILLAEGVFTKKMFFDKGGQLVFNFKGLYEAEIWGKSIEKWSPLLGLAGALKEVVKQLKNPDGVEKWTEIIKTGFETAVGISVGIIAKIPRLKLEKAFKRLEEGFEEFEMEIGEGGVLEEAAIVMSPEVVITFMIAEIWITVVAELLAKYCLANFLTGDSFLAGFKKIVMDPLQNIFNSLKSGFLGKKRPPSNGKDKKHSENKKDNRGRKEDKKSSQPVKRKKIPVPKIVLHVPLRIRKRAPKTKKPRPYWQPFPFWPSFWFIPIGSNKPRKREPKIPVPNLKPPRGQAPVPIYPWQFYRNGYNPNPNPNIQPSVGGVLFDKSAELLTDIEEIKGAYWDEKLSQLVLVGKRNGADENFLLPKMDTDHLAVVIRAVFSNDNLGVSIDQPAGYENSGKFPPDGTMMPVRYLGNTRDTLFGAIMFEADRLLKNLSLGVDNENKKPVNSKVTDFKNELDLSIEIGNTNKNSWTRMWFVIENMQLQLDVEETDDRSSIMFSKASLKVKAEYLNQQLNPGVDPVAERFSKHFTCKYDEFAKEFPVLERLRELAKIVAIVKWLKESGKPVDLSLLNNCIIKVPTPSTTPGIIASKKVSSQNGNIITTQTFSLYGGVDFDFSFTSTKDNGRPQALKNLTNKSKPAESANKWDFEGDGNSLRALAVSLKNIEGGFHYSITDYKADDFNSNLEITRIYNSIFNGKSMFGNGWDLQTPYEISVPVNNSVNPYILLKNRVEGTVYKYYYIKEKDHFVFVKEEKEVEVEEGGKKHKQISYMYDPENFIKRNQDSSFSFKDIDKIHYHFNQAGELIKIDFDKNYSQYFVYDNGNIIKIIDTAKSLIQFVYDENNRIVKAACPRGLTINYYYDFFGNLSVTKDSRGNCNKYVYGEMGLLTKGLDQNDKVLFRNDYDGLKRKITKQYDTVVNENGELIKKEYDSDHKLLKEEDSNGNTTLYKYDGEGNLLKSVFTDSGQRETVVEYDKAERVKKVTDPVKYTQSFEYNSLGFITSYTDSNNNAASLKYDENNNLLSYTDGKANVWKQEFDKLERLANIIDPGGRKVTLEYDKSDNIRKIIAQS